MRIQGGMTRTYAKGNTLLGGWTRALQYCLPEWSHLLVEIPQLGMVRAEIYCISFRSKYPRSVLTRAMLKTGSTLTATAPCDGNNSRASSLSSWNSTSMYVFRVASYRIDAPIQFQGLLLHCSS